MLELIVALALFIALHSIPAIPAIRNRLISTLGRRTYLTAYSIVSIAVLIWLFKAALETDYIQLWEPAPWQARVTLVAAPLGLFLVLTGLFSRNPFSISLRSDDGTSGAIVTITRHPVLWGFLLWALGHLVPNGDLRSLILFGGFAVFSIGGLFMLEKRARRKFGAAWLEATSASSVVPFKAMIEGRAKPTFDLSMAVAALSTALLVGWLLVLGGHALLFGADPLLAAF